MALDCDLKHGVIPKDTRPKGSFEFVPMWGATGPGRVLIDREGAGESDEEADSREEPGGTRVGGLRPAKLGDRAPRG